MEYYLYYRKIDGLVVGDMGSDIDFDFNDEKYDKFVITEEQYANISGKINVRVVNGELLYNEYIPVPTESQLLGQMYTDMELKILSVGANVNV